MGHGTMLVALDHVYVMTRRGMIPSQDVTYCTFERPGFRVASKYIVVFESRSMKE